MPRISDGQGHELQLGSNTSLPVSSTTIEALLGALNSTAVIDPTASGSEIALLKGIIKQLQGDGTAGKSAPVSLTGSLANPTASITIGTGAVHSAGDVVSTDAGAILSFETGLPAGSGGIILGSAVTLRHNAVFVGGAGYTLYLFNVTPTVQATNAAYDLALADEPYYVGKIIISPLELKTSSCAITDVNHNLPFKLATGDTKLYGKAVCNGAETTVTGKVLNFKIKSISA